jgi:hypothetical protein
MYGIDAERLTVWIEPLETVNHAMPGVLCRRHADAMVVPQRWTLDDRREPVPRLFRSPPGPAPAEEKRATRRRPSGLRPKQLRLDADPPDAGRHAADDPSAAVPVNEADPQQPHTDPTQAGEAADPTSELAWRPVFDESDDLGGLLHANSPLLSRAFRGEDRPKQT